MSATPDHTGTGTVICCPRKAAAVRQDRSNCCTKPVLPSCPDCWLFPLFLPGKQHVCWEREEEREELQRPMSMPLQHFHAPSSCEWRASRTGMVSGTTGISLSCGTKGFAAAWQAQRVPSLQQTPKETNRAQACCTRHWEECSSAGWGMAGAGRARQQRQLLIPASALQQNSLSGRSLLQQPPELQHRTVPKNLLIPPLRGAATHEAVCRLGRTTQRVSWVLF